MVARASEPRHTHSGKDVSNIRLTANCTVKGKEKTQFNIMICWDRVVETTAEYLKRGDSHVFGSRLQFPGWLGN